MSYCQSCADLLAANREYEEANERLKAQQERLADALRYARRFLNSKDHDTAFVDAALAEVGEQETP